jgi:hypothetical protein
LKHFAGTKLFAILALLFSTAAFSQQIVTPYNGGTGVSQANTKTITLGGPLVTSGAYTTTLTATNTTGVTLPTSGTLAILGANTLTGLQTFNAGATVASGQTLTLTGATVAGAPTWSSSQAITLSTAAQPNVTSLGTIAALVAGTGAFSGAISQPVGTTNFYNISGTTGVGYLESVTGGAFIGIYGGTHATKANQLDIVGGSGINILNNAAVTGTLGVTGAISGGNGLVVTGTGSGIAAAATQMILGATGATSSIAVYGTAAGAGNRGAFGIISADSAGANALQLMSITPTGAVSFPSLPSAQETDIVCYSTSTGVLSYATSVAGCVPSDPKLKIRGPDLTPTLALARIETLTPGSGVFKPEANLGSNEQVWLYADEVCKMDSRLCVKDANGILNYDKVGMLAYVVAAVKAQQVEINKLKRERMQ